MKKKIKHLEMIENVIERMGKNSFQLKGWTITVVSLIGAIVSQVSNGRLFLLMIIPILAFWFLDAYYLQLERKYRALYKIVSEKDENSMDFSMDVETIECDIKDIKKVCYCNCLFSKTECPFYLVLSIMTGLLAFII